MRTKYIMTVCLLLVFTVAFAQRKRYHFKFDQVIVYAGTNIGGVAPIGIPAEIRKINNYSPINPFIIGAEVSFLDISDRWSVLAGLNVESRSMNAGAFAENFKGVIDLENTPFQGLIGYFTGSVESNFQNWYLTLPLSAQFDLTKKWKLFGGVSISKTISRSFEGGVRDAYIRLGSPTTEKIPVPTGSFDLSEMIRKVDAGIHGGAIYIIDEKWILRSTLNYGLTNVIDAPKEYLPVTLHNIFFNLSLGYSLPVKL